MRELDECTAEVFRRGEQRLRERRRKRNRVLAACVPVCLIAAVWPAVIFPQMTPALETSDFAQYAEEIVDNHVGSPACSYIAVEIRSAGTVPERRGEVTDRLAVGEMFSAVNSFFADSDFADVDGSAQGAVENFPASRDESFPSEDNIVNSELMESADHWKDYTITFTAGDGSQAAYRISANALVNEDTNETVFLSDAQAAGLRAVLGISE